MITSVVQRKRPRLPFYLLIGGAVVVAGLAAAVAFAVTNDSGTVNVEVTNRTTSVVDATTAQGAFISYFGDSDTTFGAAGTGLFNPFVRLQGSPTEQGYNTNGTTQFDTKTGTWTHAIKVSEIPQRPCPDPGATTTCYELFNDINDTNSAKHISLDKVELYFVTGTGTPNSATLVTGYPFTTPNPATTTTTLQYAFNGHILINDVNQGSGRGDLRYDIPLSLAPLPANCNYGNPLCTTWFLLYSQWGLNGATYNSDGGFEEWRVKIYPTPPDISVVKTPDSEATGAGTVTAGSNAVFTIVATNNGPITATALTLTDVLPSGSWTVGGANAASCAGTNPHAGGTTLTCNFGDVPYPGSRTITLTRATVAADCTAGTPTGDINNTATVSATNEDGTDQTNNSDHGDVHVVCPDVSIVKTPDSEATGAGTVTAGSNAVFTIVTTNNGPGTATSVTTTDNLPAGSGPLHWTIDTDATNLCSITGADGSQVLSCPYGAVASGASRTVIVKAATSAGDCALGGVAGDIVNTASTSATNESSTTLANNSDHGDVNVQCPDVSIVKTPDSESTGAGTVGAGSDAVFTVVTTNNGPGTATAVTTTDNLPAGTALDWSIDTDATGLCTITGSLGSEILSCPYGDLASGVSRTVIVKAATSGADCFLNGDTGDIENTASTSATNEASTTLTNNSDHGDVNVTCSAIQILKKSTKTGNPLVLVAGAVFHVIGPGGYAADVTDTTDGTLGDEDTAVGSVCISGLVPGEYTVSETSAPVGYGSGTAVDPTATAANGTDCGSHTPSIADLAVFTDPPLSDIQVNFRDGGSGETSATIVCDNTTGTQSTDPENGWDTSDTETGVNAPTVVVCTITIDP
jgi:uncharacterized repeat protein (TIGR01451 family)